MQTAVKQGNDENKQMNVVKTSKNESSGRARGGLAAGWVCHGKVDRQPTSGL
jgi:hypothetical protein